jgi:hypothetical protein
MAPEASMTRPALALSLMASALLLSACQRTVKAYQGAERPAASVATIVPENAYNRARSSLLGAPCGDHEVLVRVNGQCLGGSKSTFTVLPGRHVLAVAYRDSPARLNGSTLVAKSVSLPLDAVAGHVYAIRGRTDWSSGTPAVTLIVVDGSTRQTVSSVSEPAANVRIIRDDFADLDTD